MRLLCCLPKRLTHVPPVLRRPRVLVNLLAAAADCGVALLSRGRTTDVAARVAFAREVEAAAAAAVPAEADGTQLSYAPPSPKLLAAAKAYRQFCDNQGDIRKQ